MRLHLPRALRCSLPNLGRIFSSIPFRGTKLQSANATTSTTCKEYLYEAPLDHFSANNKHTISIRYWVDDSCVDTEKYDISPMFVQMGGEGAASCAPCADGLSKKYKGISVAVEHRFYGKSVPLGGLSTSNLQYLTVDQNLEDTKGIIEILNPHGTHKVITHGGSYSGGTASWFRTQYPETTFASLSSSGVVNAIVDFVQFDESVVTTLKKYKKYPACLDNLVGAFDFIDALSSTELQALKSSPFNATNLVADIDFFYMVADAVAMAVQYGHKEKLCIAMKGDDKIPASKTVELLATFILEYYGEDFQSQPFYDRNQIAKMVSQSQTGVGAKSWRWQKCTQVAYLQSRIEDGTSKLGLRSRKLTQQSLMQQCTEMFPNSTLNLYKSNAKFQKKYGAARPDLVGATRIFCFDYSDDPWKEASVNGPFPASLDLPYCYTDCDGCGHCGSGVPSDLTKCNDFADKKVGEWLSRL